MSILNYPKRKLLLPMRGSNGGTIFKDYSQADRTVTAAGSAQTKTDQFKYYDSSGYFNGSTDYLYVTDNIGTFAGRDFQIEAWIWTTTSTAYACIIGRPSNTSFTAGAWNLFINNGSANGLILVYLADYSTGAPFMVSSGSSIRDGAWHHIAWSKSDSHHYLWVDGVQVATREWAGSISASARPTYIGTDANFAGRKYAGYIQDLSIMDDAEGYSSPFTPPEPLLGTISNLGTGVSKVLDVNGDQAERSIIAFAREGASGQRVINAQSDASGEFSFYAPKIEHDVVFLDPGALGTTGRFDKLVSRVIPA